LPVRSRIGALEGVVIGIGRIMKPWYVWRPWQLARRARVEWTAPCQGDQTLAVAWGVSLRVDPRTTIGRSIQTTGVHDPAVTEILARLIRAGDTVVDAGAHVGYMTTLAALGAGPGGHVLAWEPLPQLFDALGRNVAAVAARWPIARITLRNAALGSAPGQGALVLPKEDASNDATGRLDWTGRSPAQSIPVRIETIDDAVGVESIDVMKLDVEGSEGRVLAGARRALEARRIRHIVFEDHEGPASEVILNLQSLDYEVFAIGWSIRGPRLGPVRGGSLAAVYEAPSYLATLAPHDVRDRCAKGGWTTLSARFAGGLAGARGAVSHGRQTAIGGEVGPC
jgi:FkbM family methyltransferase